MIFLSADDRKRYHEASSDVLARELPPELRGYPTNFDEPFSGEGLMLPIEKGPVKHWVAITTIPKFFKRYLEILAAGGSAAPEAVLQRAGIDISSPDFWQGGFDVLAGMVAQLEQV